MSVLVLSLLVLPWCPGAVSLVLSGVTVPPYGLAGESVSLVCEYDRQGDEIYSVKWYKGGREFYRYIPGNGAGHQVTVYPRPGVVVDQAVSDDRRVTLRQLSLATTGRYRCEVSSEAPTFATDSGFGDLLVVVLPREGPVIDGAEKEYKVGDNISLTCTSHSSKPAADLVWFINDREVEKNNTGGQQIVTDPVTQLHTSLLTLDLTLGTEHVTDGGNISITCTASIGGYWSAGAGEDNVTTPVEPVDSWQTRNNLYQQQAHFAGGH